MPDHFQIGFKLHSFECSPQSISDEFGIGPYAFIEKGRQFEDFRVKRSSWFSNFHEGFTNEEFSEGLEKLLAFIELHREFIASLIFGGAEMIVEIKHASAVQEGVIFDLKLEPFLLHALGLHPIGLQVMAFTAEEAAVETPEEPLPPMKLLTAGRGTLA